MSTSAPPRASSPPSVAQRSTRLLRRYAEDHDPADLEELVQRFRPLARRLALRYARGGEPLDDLEQVANLGLVKALQRYDPSRGFAFTSYAVPTILGELKRSFRDSAWAAHVPRSLQERAANVREAADRLEGRLGRPPTLREIADAAELTEEEVLDGLEALGAQSSLSIDAPAGVEDDLTMSDQLGDTDGGYERVEDLAAIGMALSSLTPIQRSVLRLRFEEGLKQSDIAHRIGVSQMQVSRVLRSALDRLSIVAAHQSRPPRRAAA
jgi:RNA polymerase sigma-B factor